MIEVNERMISDVQRRLGQFKNKAPTVISRALNRAASNAKTNAVKKAKEEYEVKSTDVRSTIQITKSNRNQLGAMVTSTSTKLPLHKFKVSPKTPRPRNPQRLKVAVKKSGLKELMHAFVANVNGNKVFERETSSRLPIKQLFGPSVPEMLGNRDVKSYIEDEAVRIFDRRLDHEINRVLEVNRS